MTKNPLTHAIVAFSLWGLLPLYLKQMPSFSAYEITAYRVILSFITLLVYLLIRDGSKTFLSNTARLLKSTPLYFSSILIGINWFLFVYCIDKGIILEASFGYFSGPLVSIFLGLVFLKEKISPLKLIAIILAVFSVALQASFLDSFPWIAVILALSFALYGLFKKFTKTESLNSLFFESLILLIPSIWYVIDLESKAQGALKYASSFEYFFICFSGVMTILPLFFFTKAAKKLPLNVLGFVQYLAPLLQFLVGYLVYKEDLSNIKAISFVIIWASCMIILIDQNRRKI